MEKIDLEEFGQRVDRIDDQGRTWIDLVKENPYYPLPKELDERWIASFALAVIRTVTAMAWPHDEDEAMRRCSAGSPATSST